MECLSDELQIYVLKSTVNQTDCQKIMKFIDNCAKKAHQQCFQQGRYLQFVTDTDVANWLWSSYLSTAREQWPELNSCCPTMPVARYYNEASVGTGVHRERCSQLVQAIVYPNQTYDGGEISFHRESEREQVIKYKPTAGDIVLFPSQTYHCGHVSSNGQKYILVARLES